MGTSSTQSSRRRRVSALLELPCPSLRLLESSTSAAPTQSVAAQSMAAARESLYTGGYLGVVPVLYDTLREAPWMADYPASTPLIVSGAALFPISSWDQVIRTGITLRAHGGTRRHCGVAARANSSVTLRLWSSSPSRALLRLRHTTIGSQSMCLVACRHHGRPVCSNRIPAARHHQDTVAGARTSHCDGRSAADTPCRL